MKRAAELALFMSETEAGAKTSSLDSESLEGMDPAEIRSKLLEAAENNKPEDVKIILNFLKKSSKFTDNEIENIINAKDAEDDTLLLLAAEKGHIEVVNLLLSQPGIEINAVDKIGWTPLLLAAIEGHTEVVQLLLAQPGIKVNVANSLGHTPLKEAIKKRHTEIIKLLLLQPGINLNGIDGKDIEDKETKGLFD